MNKLVLLDVLQVLCVGALIHPGVGVDKPPPKPPFEADFCSKRCWEGASVQCATIAVCMIPTTAIRRPVDRDFPFGFEEFVKKKVCVNTCVL